MNGDVLSGRAKKRSVRVRRDFLKASCLGAAGVFVSGTLNTPNAAAASECAYRLSAFDALTMFSDLLLQLQSQSFTLLHKKMEVVAVDCQGQLRKLCESVQKLSDEIAKRGANSSNVDHLKVLAELGCASADQVSMSTSVTTSAAALQTLESVNKKLLSAAEELLPSGEATLSTEATNILRLIIVQIHQSAATQRSITETRAQSREAHELIVNGIQTIQRLMRDAGDRILTADEGKPEQRAQARQDAITLLRDARTKLNEFVEKLKMQQLYDPESPANFLALALEGTEQWVRDPESVGAVSRGASDTDEARMERAIYVVESRPADVRGFQPAQVAGLLHSYCQPDSLLHVGQVMTALTPVRGWKILIDGASAIGLRGAPTFGEVLSAVSSALRMGRLVCSESQDHKPNVYLLATELTRIIMA